MTAPKISVVTATYNRSNVLDYCIRTVLWQSVTDWEMWIVGDACTDDTETVVAAFGDPRIHFANLPQNCGEQSAANNEGVRRSSGEYIAFLNHDDLWFPDHLATGISVLDTTGADMTICLDERIAASGEKRVSGVVPGYRWTPGVDNWIEASTWIVRRTTIDKVGMWRPSREIHLPPSQDWLSRCWRAGMDMRIVPLLTAICPSSPVNSYVDRPDEPQRSIFEAMATDPEAFRARELGELLFHQQSRLTDRSLHAVEAAPRELLLAFFRQSFRGILRKLRIDPRHLRRARRGARRGAAIDALRRRRGLEPISESQPSHRDK